MQTLTTAGDRGARRNGTSSQGATARPVKVGVARGTLPRAAMIDTKKVQRRELRFRSIADMEREVDRLVAGDRSGRIKLRGNWTLGQILNHLSAWVDFYYIGFPIPRAPLMVRLIVKVMKGKFLNGRMPQGIRLPNVKDGTLGTEAISLDDGLAKFHGAIGRLKAGEPPRHPSPAFGPMTLDEVVKLTLRHAELHLGFADA